MDIKDYEFHVGDEVITAEGVIGKITNICTCDRCERRGFYEPFWSTKNDKWEHCIHKYVAENGFRGFYKIGKYHFDDFDKGEVLRNMGYHEDQLKKLRNQLKVIEEYENA